MKNLDNQIELILEKELSRQKNSAVLIASENYASEKVRNYSNTIFTNKYAEGYPGARYYAGCENADEVENLAITRGKKLFSSDHINVQPHSGSQANMAAYISLLKPGDKILSLSLDHGGHLSHGHNVNFSGKIYDIHNYYLNEESELLDFDHINEVAEKNKPKLIVCGYSAYSRVIDFKKFKQIAENVNSLLLADIAHISGLVASGLHPTPVGIADIITSTTHKTLRGPRGGLAIVREDLSNKYDRGVFPAVQGGPLMNTILAKAVAFKEALSQDFINYSKKILENAKTLENLFISRGLRLVSGGTDNHLMLIDTRSIGINGSEAENKLSDAGIIVNKNAIPFDPEPPKVTSGIRIGTPAITSREISNEDLLSIGNIIVDSLISSSKKSGTYRQEVEKIMNKLPLP
ncbi:MAG: serine hydroxymethyltransferase [Dehalococcoidia bacterium]|nr:serine hydroxymethyltransferase [Dehalococcoidia bacterium]